MQKLAVAAFLSLSLIAIDTAQSATFNVTNTNATGAGSFRQAMIDANASLDASNTIQVQTSPGAFMSQLDLVGGMLDEQASIAWDPLANEFIALERSDAERIAEIINVLKTFIH